MKTVLSFLFLFGMGTLFAQSPQQLANIGDFTTSSGETIKDCKVGYRTLGDINSDGSNVILWCTWFTGTSGQVFDFGVLNNIIDTAGHFVVIVDALTNGVSSSPSNTEGFPVVTIGDMVNSQYQLLTQHMGIERVKAVMGISMGGMQAFEWVAAYPTYMDKAISIVGTPRQSSYDKLVWQTEVDIIEAADTQDELAVAYQLAYRIQLMNMYTPHFVASTYGPDSLHLYVNQFPTSLAAEDYLGGLQAMIPHDIHKTIDGEPEEIQFFVEAELLVIVATEDHLVNPLSSIDLAERLDARLVTLESNCGHMVPFCEGPRIKEEVTSFLD